VTPKTEALFSQREAAEEAANTLNGWVWDMSGASNLQELAARLRATCMVRRRKQDVLLELPAKQLTVLPVELTLSERTEYDLAQKDVLDWIAARAGQDPEFRALIAGLDAGQQLAAVLHRAQVAVDRAAQAEELVRIEALKQISARGKLAAAQEWIGNFLATDQKLVVFAWHQEILDALSAMFPGAGVISGETPIAHRQRIVDDFQRKILSGGVESRHALLDEHDRIKRPGSNLIGAFEPDPRSSFAEPISRSSARPAQNLILLNLQTGGVGLTLTAASNVLLLELPWTPAMLDQAIDRCHRIGQRAAVNAWLMMGRRTIDFAIWKMLQTKRTTAEAATR
jgi:SNF2 family DNA or RNA helicase